jgi:diguanylate cyclase (GGDEF)-like protein
VVLVAWLDYATGPQLCFALFYLLPVAACAWWGGFPHGILVSLGGALAWHVIEAAEGPPLPPVIAVWNGVVRFGMLALVSSLVSRVHAGMRRERLLARTDPLTGAANGRTFYEAAAAEATRARRSSLPLTVAYLDLDHFKQLNDRLGHAAGDEALRRVVRAVGGELRAADLLARLGGDEFALLLPGTDGEGATALLGRLQGRVSQEVGKRGWPVTLSVGAVTFLRPPGDVDRIVAEVDALMYRAKRRGKGRVQHAVRWGGEGSAWPGAERRATARVLCDLPVRVRREGEGGAATEFGTVRDLSAEGLCLELDRAVPEGAVVLVEPLTDGGATLLARVLRVWAAGSRWRHGCRLAAPLGAEEFCRWVGKGERSAPPAAAERAAADGATT